MALMRGEPLIRKLATVATNIILPTAMVASVIYSPPSYISSKDNPKFSK